MSKKIDLSQQAYIHINGESYPQNTLFNALLAIRDEPSRNFNALVDVDGRSFTNEEISDLLQSEEFIAHEAELRAQGKRRD